MEGNQMKMREALVKILRLANVTADGENWDWNNAIAENVVKVVKEALSAPPRNCDVGTPDERMHRYHELCREISDRHERIGAHAPSFAFPTEFEWEDRPYEEKEGAGNERR